MSDKYDDLILNAGHQASQDFDAWVLKLGTAGMTLVLGVAALIEAASLSLLVWSGAFFAAALVAGLASLRLSADGLRRQAEDEDLDTDKVWQFRWVTWLNWAAFIILSAAFIILAVFIGVDAIPKSDGG